MEFGQWVCLESKCIELNLKCSFTNGVWAIGYVSSCRYIVVPMVLTCLCQRVQLLYLSSDLLLNFHNIMFLSSMRITRNIIGKTHISMTFSPVHNTEYHQSTAALVRLNRPQIPLFSDTDQEAAIYSILINNHPCFPCIVYVCNCQNRSGSWDTGTVMCDRNS